MKKELEVAIKAAKEAGKILKDNFHEVNSVTLKQGESWVTEIDKLSETKIISIIKDNFPSHSINAEESGLSETASDYLWVIDPLDGTTNYATQVPLFAVSIALAKNKEVVLGVIYDPIHENLYSAEKREGAKLNNSPIKVSKTEELRSYIVGYGCPARVKEKFVEIFSKVSVSTRTPKVLGSMTLCLGYMANGNLDTAICISPKPWDLAAGSLIVEEAGGKVTDFEGNPWSLNSTNILATNGKIHQALLGILKE